MSLPLDIFVGPAESGANQVLAWNSTSVEVEQLNILLQDYERAESASAKIGALIAGHQYLLDFNRQKLQALVGSALCLDDKVTLLQLKMQDLQTKYNQFLAELETLSDSLPPLLASVQQIDEKLIVKATGNYRDYSDNLALAYHSYAGARLIDRDLAIYRESVKTLSLISQRELQQLDTNLQAGEKQLQATDSAHLELTNLHTDIQAVLNQCQVGLRQTEKACNEVENLNAVVIRKTVEYLDLLASLEGVTKGMMQRTAVLEQYIASFNSQYEEANCYFSRKEKELSLLTNSCRRNYESLRYYHDLFVGSNFIRAGDNIQLNRTGCAVIVNAYLPELKPCPKPPVLPPMAGDISVNQEPLPDCPPPLCKTDSPTPPPTRNPQEGTGKCEWLTNIRGFHVHISFDASGSTTDGSVWETDFSPKTQKTVITEVCYQLSAYLTGKAANVVSQACDNSIPEQIITCATNVVMAAPSDIPGFLVIRVDDSEDIVTSSRLFEARPFPIYVLHLRLVDSLTEETIVAITKQTYDLVVKLLDLNLAEKRIKCWAARAYDPDTAAHEAVTSVFEDAKKFLPYS